MIAPLVPAFVALAGMTTHRPLDPDADYRQDDAALRPNGRTLTEALDAARSDLDRSYDLLATIGEALGLTDYDRTVLMDLAVEKAKVFSTPAAIADATLEAYYLGRASDLASIEETSEPLNLAA